MSDPQPLPRLSGPPMECPNGICDRLQIAEWDVQTLKLERDAAIAAAVMDHHRALEWVVDRYEATLAGRSVRDVDECLAHARRLLGKETSDAL